MEVVLAVAAPSFTGPAVSATDGRDAVAAAMCDRDDGKGAPSPVGLFSL